MDETLVEGDDDGGAGGNGDADECLKESKNHTNFMKY